MPEVRPTRREWRRVFVESVAVVLSILVAFAIDAWWDSRQDLRDERELLAGLVADFEASRPALESRRELAHRMADGTRAFLDLTTGVSLPARLAVPDTVLMAVLGGPTYDAVTNTLDAAVASGEIELIRSKELRAQLAQWRRQLTDTSEDELEVRRVTNQQIVPLLSRVLNIRPYFDSVLAWSGGDPFGVGALSVRSFYADFSAGDFEELLIVLDRTLALLRQELGE
jgi:hypothetical protein